MTVSPFQLDPGKLVEVRLSGRRGCLVRVLSYPHYNAKHMLGRRFDGERWHHARPFPIDCIQGVYKRDHIVKSAAYPNVDNLRRVR